MMEHWSSIKFEDIVDNFKRGPFGSTIKKVFFVPKGYKVYEQQNAIYDDNERGKYYISKDKFNEMEDFAVFPGDYIVSCSGTIGKISKLPPTAQQGIINQALLRIRLKGHLVDDQWFLYFFRSLFFQKRILKETRGSAMKNIAGVKELREVCVELPSLLEQNKIVDLLEELLSDLDNAIYNLKKAKDQLKIYRQSVLKYAFEKKLTEGWRRQVKLSNTDWIDMSVGDVGEVVTGTTPSKKEPKYYGNKYPFYKPGDLDAGYFTNSSVDNLSEAGMKKARLLPAECVLITCIGSTIGKTGLIRKTGACNQQINAIIPNENVVSEYFYFFAISPWFQEQIKSTASATTLPILNKTKFQRLIVKVPSVDEQLQIVKEIERRFSICNQLYSTIDEQLQRAEALRQSILKQAFEGKLTEEWRKEHPELISGENSAKALLEKIKAEREVLKNTGKRKK